MVRVFKLKFLAATGLAICLSAPVAAQSSGIEALLEQARYWQERGRRDRANEAYRRVLAIDPDNAQARRGLQSQPSASPSPSPAPNAVRPQAPARSGAARQEVARPTAAELAGRDRAAGFDALETGQLVEASRLFESALSRAPNDADSLGGLGLVRLRNGRFAEARDLLRRASRLGDSSRWTQALRSAEFFAGLNDARSALAAGRLAEAERIAADLVETGFTEPAPAYEVLATIYERQGLLMKAADALSRATQFPDVPAQSARRMQTDALRLQAMAAKQAGELTVAEQLFQQGMMTDNEDPWIRYEFARLMIKEDRLPETESLINALSHIQGPDASYASALLLEQLGRPSQAKAAMDMVSPSAMTPEMREFVAGLQVDLAIERARALAGEGQAVSASAALREVAASAMVSPAKTAGIAGVLYEIGDTAGAAQIARQALEGEPTDLASYEPIIRVLTQTGQDAFAMSALRKAEDLAANSPSGMQTVAGFGGMIAAVQADQLREGGYYAESFDLLQAAWAKSPGNVDVLAALARLYQSGEMPLQATQTFQMVLQQKPDDLGAMIGLIDSAAKIGENRLAERTLDSAIARHPEDYEVYLAGARLAQARGKESEARDYLETARSIYVRRQGLASGGFPATNPFARRTDLARAATPKSVNPFELGTNPVLANNLGADFAVAPRMAGRSYTSTAAPAARSSQSFTVQQSGANSYDSYTSRAPAQRANGYAARSSFADSTREEPVSSGDPVLDRIQRELNQLETVAGPMAELVTNFRDRSGETGLSSLQQIGATASTSTDFAGGRIGVSAEAVVIDAGRPTGSGLARFGRNGLIEAQAIVDEEEAALVSADTQHASGLAVSASYKNDLIEAEVGTTPLGFETVRFAGGLAVTPRFSSNSSGRLFAERRPVEDSIISYSGTHDPVTDTFWGAVMRTGGGASFSWERDGTGIYADGHYFHYEGVNVRDNESIELNAGGYLRAFTDETSQLTFGINANYQSYDNNQNYFTEGHGGYFSPQSFLSVGFPVRYSYSNDWLEARASVSPGYQSYEQQGEALYPVDPSAQQTLNALRIQNSDVRAYYDTISDTGIGFALDGSAYYRVSPNTRIGGELNYNTFGVYNEFKSMFGVRQAFGGKD